MARKHDVAVMHDFFVDRLVHVPDLGSFLGAVAGKSKAGGGGIHGVRQSDIRGGNAVNLAHALARLGMRVLLITHSDTAHSGMVERSFEGLQAEVRLKPSPPGLTVAFEERTNVMAADGGGASDFGPGALDHSDWEALRRARVVCSVNWAANSRGTELLAALRKNLGPDATLFLDPADFRDRRGEFSELLARIGRGKLVDWMAMNEFEAAASAELLGLAAGGVAGTCNRLASALGVKMDVHGERGSATSDGRRTVTARAKRVKPLRRTGAGDVWDAASVYGRLKGMDDEERLDLANAAAWAYLRSKDPVPPTLEECLAASRRATSPSS